MYARLGKLLFLVGLPLVFVYFRLVSSRRARVIVQNKKGEVLLVKSWLGRQNWNLPGGGIKPWEDPKDAAARELAEETGVTNAVLTFADEQRLHGEAGAYNAFIFTARVKNAKAAPKAANRAEIIDVKWCKVDDLPEKVAKIVTPYL